MAVADGSMTADPEGEDAPETPGARFWEVTVVRGDEVETREFQLLPKNTQHDEKQ